ncbi:MAG: outer membrane protein assembly factor BamA [Treponema sp.]|nr:outer membrane protein assembly factor BamA [Treponema sp.]
MRRGLAFILLTICVFSGFAQAADEERSDWFQGVPIRNIIFEGLNSIRDSELEGIVAPFIGRDFSDDLYWEILGRLYALEYFDQISPTAVRVDAAGSAVVLRFTVQERPTVSRINFVGNSGVRRNDLLDTITLSTNDIVTQIRIRLDEIAILNRYIERGFPDATVSTEILPGRGNSVIVNFHIYEGERITIEAFHFEGNTLFSNRTLERQLSLRTRGIIRDGAFQEARLIADRQTLAQYYHDRGYIDAEVVDVVQEINRDDRGNNRMTITFRIYEGRMYTFGGMTFEGNVIFSDEQLQNLVNSRVGEMVNDRRVQMDLMRIADIYYSNGYIFNRIEPIPSRDTESGVLSFHILIVERGRAHIENIIVRGNVKTRDSVILREIPLEPGDIFSQTKIMDGLRNLQNLQYFSMIFPETPPGSVDSLMDLVITVEEQPTTTVNFGVTFSGSADPDHFPISLMAMWTDTNFRGSGNIVGAEINASPDTQTFSTNYTHRWIFGLPLSGNFDLTVNRQRRRAAMQNFAPFFHGDEPYAFPSGFHSFQEYEEANKVPPDQYLMTYNQWRVSLGVGTGYRWSTFLGNLGLGGGFRIGMLLSTFDHELYIPFDPILRERNNLWTPALSFWTSVSLDQRDIFFDPSRGYYAIQRFGWHGILPVEQEHYIRTDTRVEWFHTLFDIPVGDNWSFKAVFGVHSGLSFIFRQPNKDQPFIEDANALAVDGMFIGRGWSSEFRRKGYALWTNWAEIRIPLAPGIIAWDFFFDAAGVKRTPQALFQEFKADDGSHALYETFFMRFSMGGGFRFAIPQFPFRFSLAKRFIIRDNQVVWMPGAIGRGDSEHGGLDLVISFALSTY